MNQSASVTSLAHRTRRYAIGFALVFPTLLTYAYFVYLAERGGAVQQAVYTVGKILQFAFPLAWVCCFHRARLAVAGPSRWGVIQGGALGLVMAGAILALYYLVFYPAGWLDGPDQAVRAKLQETGLDTLSKFVGAAIFYCLVHSLLEEYYWRWFVYGELREVVAVAPAIAISSLGFMAHHVIVLGIYFGWQSPLTYIFSLGIAGGGAIWAWIYHRSGTLYGAWLSHLLVDAAIFAIGYDLAREILS